MITTMPDTIQTALFTTLRRMTAFIAVGLDLFRILRIVGGEPPLVVKLGEVGYLQMPYP